MAFLVRVLTVMSAVGFAAAACKVGSMDLSSLASTPLTWQDEFVPPVFEYEFTFCGTDTCGDGVSSICQKSLNYPPQNNLAVWDDTVVWTKTSSGYSTTFSNGDTCNGSPRVANVDLVCGSEVSLVEVIEDPEATCSYNVQVTIPCSMSGGSIFLIAVLVGTILYFGLGCLYKRKKMGATSVKESIPNIDFWTTLPGLVKDGFYFVVRDRCRAAGTGGGYEEI